MTTVREPVLDDKTQSSMQKALNEALIAVKVGDLSVEDALANILYLIASIDNGEPSEIATWTAPGALVRKSS